jgi:transposase
MARGQRVPQEARDEILVMFRAGASPYSIAEELGLGHQTIYRILREAGAMAIRGDQIYHLSKEERAQLIEDYVRGDNVDEIRLRYKVSLELMYRMLSQAGIPRRHEQYLASRKMALEDAIQMYREGAKLVDIKLATRVSASTLMYELRKRDVPMRTELKKAKAADTQLTEEEQVLKPRSERDNGGSHTHEAA